MAFKENAPTFSLEAGADLSSSQYTFVAINSSGQVVNTGAAADADGVVCNTPASGEAAEVAHGGLVQITASAAISAGDDVASAANGQARTATTSDAIMGRAVTAASGAGAVFSMHFLPRAKDSA